MVSVAHKGFVIENEWYWRITENAQTFDASAAVRDFLVPLARLAKDTLAITDVTVDGDAIRFVLGTTPVTIDVPPGSHDRVAVNRFVGDLNRVIAGTRHAFALLVPRRYELRGVLLAVEELAALAGNPQLLVPSGRPSWRAMPAATP